MPANAQNQTDYEALCRNRESYGFSQEECDRWIREQNQRSPTNSSGNRHLQKFVSQSQQGRQAD